MSHCCTLVVVPNGTTREDAEAIVEPLLAPWNEHTNDEGWWDWYQVGGRYTGRWSEYDPAKDPANMVACVLCNGTGTRLGGLAQFGPEWFEHCHGCNGCQGLGWHVVWTTQYGAFDGDVFPVKVLLNNPGVPMPFRVLLPDGRYLERETYVPDNPQGERFVEMADFDAKVIDALEPFAGEALVVVDCHD